jgi:serine/threonine protein kinase
VRKIVAAVSRALEIMHASGHVHGDLHLGNVYLDEEDPVDDFDDDSAGTDTDADDPGDDPEVEPGAVSGAFPKSAAAPHRRRRRRAAIKVWYDGRAPGCAEWGRLGIDTGRGFPRISRTSCDAAAGGNAARGGIAGPVFPVPPMPTPPVLGGGLPVPLRAPEVAHLGAATPAGDMWSLGVMILVLSTYPNAAPDKSGGSAAANDDDSGDDDVTDDDDARYHRIAHDETQGGNWTPSWPVATQPISMPSSAHPLAAYAAYVALPSPDRWAEISATLCGGERIEYSETQDCAAEDRVVREAAGPSASVDLALNG